jgi:hypothetical protein
MGFGMQFPWWPDSIFVQYWRIYPDSLAGGHLPEHAIGFYLNVHNPQGNSMMGWQMGWEFGMLRFQRDKHLNGMMNNMDRAVQTMEKMTGKKAVQSLEKK